MKRIILIFIILSLFLLSSCSRMGEIVVENEYYTIHERDGKRYITMTGALPAIQRNGAELSEAPSVTFQSLSEMKNDIETGNFTAKEIWTLQKICGVNIQKETINHHHLSEPVLPDGWTISDIQWSCSPRYGFHATNRSGKKLLGSFFTEYQFDDRINSLSSHIGTDKYYVIESDDKTIHVFEHAYDIQQTSYETIYLLIHQSQQYLFIQIDNLGEDPQTEWLSRFGVREYLETESQ